jgi:hypothetical protein
LKGQFQFTFLNCLFGEHRICNKLVVFELTCAIHIDFIEDVLHKHLSDRPAVYAGVALYEFVEGQDSVIINIEVFEDIRKPPSLFFG